MVPLLRLLPFVATLCGCEKHLTNLLDLRACQLMDEVGISP